MPLTHGFDLFTFEEHVFRTAKTDTYRTEITGNFGIMAQIAWQVFCNIAVVTNTLPNTGISLPFFSSGGTSLILLLAEMGVMVNIGRNGERVAQQREQMRAQREAARAEREAELARKTIDLASARAARTEQ